MTRTHEERRRRFWGRAIRISIAGIVLPPMFGLAGTVIGMLRAFEDSSRAEGTGPDTLAADISASMLATSWGLVVSFAAAIVLVVALLRFHKLPAPRLSSSPHQE